MDKGVDVVFHALADSTRRDIVLRCLVDPVSVSRLADAYPMSFAAVQKHVVVLERAGLVGKHRRGREQLVRTDPEAVARARRALDALEQLWRGRVERMDALLGEPREMPAAETNGRREMPAAETNTPREMPAAVLNGQRESPAAETDGGPR